jgi:hypothetical protein
MFVEAELHMEVLSTEFNSRNTILLIEIFLSNCYSPELFKALNPALRFLHIVNMVLLYDR